MSATYKLLFLVTFVSLFSSCNTDEDPALEIPSIYEFSRDGQSTVDHAGQSERLDQLEIISTYMKSSNTIGASALDGELMKRMFRNAGDPFDGQVFTRDLASKCFPADTALFDGFFDALALSSVATGAASEGVAGVLVEGSTDPTKGYRVDENGVEHTQVILKGLMGAVFFYQAMEVYLSVDWMGTTGNSELVDGKNYTNMEHYFDEAFGYFGVPTDFPSESTIEDARFWGEYTNARNGDLYAGINDEMSTQFRTARAAIVAQDYEARDAAIQQIMQKWAVVAAASAVDYLNKSKSTSGNPVYRRHHSLSEAIGFMMALKYHFNGGNSKYPPHYSFAQIEQALAIVGPNTNLYAVTDSQLETAIGYVRNAFPQNDIK